MRCHQPRPPRCIHPLFVLSRQGLGPRLIAGGPRTCRPRAARCLPGSSLHAALPQQVPDRLTREPDEHVRQAGDVTNSKSVAGNSSSSPRHGTCTRAISDNTHLASRHEPTSMQISLEAGHLPNCARTKRHSETSSAATILPCPHLPTIYGSDGYISGPHCPSKLDITTLAPYPCSYQVR